ncbi:hypothetical protein CRG98_001748 [Punica granatum]|uniref:BRO1 domain-containing protein n=1 Tax=Punica granatum TaxID=22663 RepID=A0A2I0LB26_PUNGR|nr:hypothetical protein CRG98_001748 [Punica granatum]
MGKPTGLREEVDRRDSHASHHHLLPSTPNQFSLSLPLMVATTPSSFSSTTNIMLVIFVKRSISLDLYLPLRQYISFTYFECEAQNLKHKASQPNIHLEKAVVLFNLGVIYSQIGLSYDRSTMEKRCQAMQAFIATDEAFPSLDLSPPPVFSTDRGPCLKGPWPAGEPPTLPPSLDPVDIARKKKKWKRKKKFKKQNYIILVHRVPPAQLYVTVAILAFTVQGSTLAFTEKDEWIEERMRWEREDGWIELDVRT